MHPLPSALTPQRTFNAPTPTTHCSRVASQEEIAAKQKLQTIPTNTPDTELQKVAADTTVFPPRLCLLRCSENM